MEGTDEALKGRLVSFTDELDLLRSEAPNMKVSQIIWYAFNLNGFYDKVGLMENGEGRQRNMMLLFDKANKYCGNSSGLAGLFSFLTMVENMQKRGEDMEVASDTQNDDKVKIMSIHSSKGLEFPIVYLVGTHKKFRFRDGIGSSINLHKRLGLGPLCYDPEERKIYNSIFNKILDITKRGETVAEEMRLLYVALTRAREKLIVTGCVKEDLDVYINSQLLLYDADMGQPLVSGVREATSYFQWITLALALDPGECWQLKAIDNEENEDVEENKRGEGVDFTRYNMEKVIPDNIERKSPVMPVPLKMSVSEYKRLNSREEEYNEARPLYPSSNKGLSAAEMGTLVHLCLQHTDYQELKRVMDQNDDANVSADEYFYTLINRLEAQEYIKKDEKEAIDKQVITSFYTSDFCKMIMDSENIQKEIPFMFLRKWRTVAPKQEEYTEEELNRDVIIQGVIDCCFEYEGQVILLDFKTDFIYTTLDVIAERYRPQLECYWEAIARAYGKPPAHVYVYFLKAGQHYEYDMSYMGI